MSGLTFLGHILVIIPQSIEFLSEPKWAALGLFEKPVIIKSVQINVQHIETKDLPLFLKFLKILFFGQRLHYYIGVLKIIKRRPSTYDFSFSFIVLKN